MRSCSGEGYTASDINRLDAFLKRCKRYGYCPDDFPIYLNFSRTLMINCLVVFHTMLHMFLGDFYLQTLNILIIWKTDFTTLY